MSLQALGQLLPLGLAVAISSVPVTATLLILLSPNQRRSSIAFLIGWTIGIPTLAVIFTLGTAAIPDQSAGQQDLVMAIAMIVIGIGMEVLAILLWRRPARTRDPEVPGWLRTVATLQPWQKFGLAFALNLRPKALLLSAAVALALIAQPLSVGDAAIALSVYTVIGASTVGALVIFTLVDPKRAEPRLISMRDWIAKNNRIVTILILVMIGVVILGNGLVRLSPS
jgi:hypothetical protein